MKHLIHQQIADLDAMLAELPTRPRMRYNPNGEAMTRDTAVLKLTRARHCLAEAAGYLDAVPDLVPLTPAPKAADKPKTEAKASEKPKS